ncbi:MAG: 3-deoxy-D-manno-octulosonic acid transferase [Thermoanaerobaculales bacterium]
MQASTSLVLYRALMMGLLPVAIPAIKLKDLLVGKGRPTFRERWAQRLPDLPAGGIWLQAVSVGEVELTRRVVAELQRLAPKRPVAVSATTATGLDLARRTLGETVPVFACPLDLPGPVSRVLEAAQPRLLALVETELWPEMLHQAARREVPVAVVNARLSEGSFARYDRVVKVLRPLLAPLQLVLARTRADAERFAALGVPAERISVTGNVKYDLGADHRPLIWADEIRRAAGERPILVAGSTMDGEETQVLDAVDRLKESGSKPFVIFAPRHPERFDAVARLLAERGLVFVRRSSGTPPPEGADAFLIDTIGELARAYSLATVAFVGGSLTPTGGHNPLEPAVWGVPVLSGPHVHNFREVYDEMILGGGARLVADSAELTVGAAAWLDEPALAAAAGAAGREVVRANSGATERTAAALIDLMGKA